MLSLERDSMFRRFRLTASRSRALGGKSMAHDTAADWNPRLAGVKFRPSSTLHGVALGERRLMFCERRQQVFEFNATLEAIWSALANGQTPQAAAGALVEKGLDQATAEAYVGGALHEWLKQGDLTPSPVIDAIAGRPDHSRNFQIDVLRISLRLFGDIDTDVIDAAFGQFAADAPGPEFAAMAYAGSVYLFDGGIALGATPPVEFTPLLKALFTERFLASSPDGFLAHAALLKRGGKAMLLSGEPGAGKTTLCVALGSAGWTLCADDIVRIDPSGRALGIPFAPAVKTGSWDLLAPYAPDLASQPVQLRTDGQWVRYLPMPASDGAPAPIGAVLLLARTLDGPPRLEPIDALEALTTILDGAYATGHRIDAQTLVALTAALTHATCARLHYSNLERAVQYVSDHLG